MADVPVQHRPSRQVRIGAVAVGGGAPIVVQSMTNTDTADAEATARQAFDLARAGSELVRVTVDTARAAAAVPEIRARLDALGCAVPWSATSISMATSSSPTTRSARLRWRSTASTRATSARARGATSSSRR